MGFQLAACHLIVAMNLRSGFGGLYWEGPWITPVEEEKLLPHSGLCKLKNCRIFQKFRQTVQWSWEHSSQDCWREIELRLVPSSLACSMWSYSVSSTELGHTILVLGPFFRSMAFQLKGQCYIQNKQRKYFVDFLNIKTKIAEMAYSLKFTQESSL